MKVKEKITQRALIPKLDSEQAGNADRRIMLALSVAALSYSLGPLAAPAHTVRPAVTMVAAAPLGNMVRTLT